MGPTLAAPFEWEAAPHGPFLHSRDLARHAPHLFTTRHLVLRGSRAAAEWAHVAAAVGVHPARLVRLKQVHGVAVHVADGQAVVPEAEEDRPHADIVISNTPGIAVAVQTADCVPILLADPITGAVAAVHAGWRGTAAGVVSRAVDAMRLQFGTRPEALLAAIGPAIGQCCYQVGPEVLHAFRDAGFPTGRTAAWFEAEQAGDRLRLDVPRANVDQLADAGVRMAHIANCDLCTACHQDLLFSYRREGRGVGRLAAVIRPLRQADRA